MLYEKKTAFSLEIKASCLGQNTTIFDLEHRLSF